MDKGYTSKWQVESRNENIELYWLFCGWCTAKTTQKTFAQLYGSVQIYFTYYRECWECTLVVWECSYPLAVLVWFCLMWDLECFTKIWSQIIMQTHVILYLMICLVFQHRYEMCTSLAFNDSSLVSSSNSSSKERIHDMI